jgi:hypothetical protein
MATGFRGETRGRRPCQDARDGSKASKTLLHFLEPRHGWPVQGVGLLTRSVCGSVAGGGEGGHWRAGEEKAEDRTG